MMEPENIDHRHEKNKVMKRKKEKSATLDGVLDEIWKMLKRGVDRYNDPFHRPVLGTSAEAGSSLRTVILRQFILAERVLVCHTDARAPKVREIAEFDRVAWLFYHPAKKVQLRISGKATLHGDDRFADDQWASAAITSRLNYATTEPPGTPVDEPTSGLPDFLRKKLPTLLESEKGRPNFMSISCRIDSMDWLMLGILGNRRARFDWDGDRMRSTWLVP
jgi:3-hydroxyisobutyrate dehydrogenase